jgi:hypothetical protein
MSITSQRQYLSWSSESNKLLSRNTHPCQSNDQFDSWSASTGHLTKWQYRAATIFINSFSDYTHVSLPDLTMDATLDAKLDFERKALTFGISVKGYHADNGQFAEAAWTDLC